MSDHMTSKDTEEFRDKIATVDKSGKRIWIYPKKPKGRYYNYRKYLSYVLLVLLVAMPFIKVNGKPFMLFNVLEGKFNVFGVYFAPQDFYLFVGGMLILLVFIVLFTVIYGRLFCGWICPQTIFMEMVYRRIEYFIEGDYNAQKRLNKAPWTTQKILKKGVKQLIFFLIAFFVANLFLSYIIGVDQVLKIISEPIAQHWQGFIGILIFSFMFYGVFAFMREQVCTTICPYGRLQGVLLDEDSLTVAYDFVRGEPRGKMKRAKKNTPEIALDEPKLGDCIDCSLCVKVCPTGIDIRNGTQLECVNCTACMDACDEVMTKINRPEGLIRIDSYNGILHKKKSIWTKRAMAYTAILIGLLALETFMFFNRSEVETLFLRTPGLLFQDKGDGYISNLYNYQLINKTEKEVEVTFESDDIKGIVFEPIGHNPRTKADAVSEGAIFIKIPKDQLKSRKTKLTIKVFGDGKQIDEAKTTFFGPIK